MTTHTKTQEDAIEEQCLADYEAHKYKIILAEIVNGWNEHDDSVEIYCTPPARVRVLKTPENDIRRWVDHEWCDPYWDVELVEPHPALENIRSLWVYGISRSIDGEVEGTSTQRLDPNQEPAYEPQEPKPQEPEPHCSGCGHTKGEGCGCPPRTQKHTMYMNCPHCGSSLTVTTTTTIEPREQQHATQE